VSPTIGPVTCFGDFDEEKTARPTTRPMMTKVARASAIFFFREQLQK
jgi:hypothetical protein